MCTIWDLQNIQNNKGSHSCSCDSNILAITDETARLKNRNVVPYFTFRQYAHLKKSIKPACSLKLQRHSLSHKTTTATTTTTKRQNKMTTSAHERSKQTSDVFHLFSLCVARCSKPEVMRIKPAPQFTRPFERTQHFFLALYGRVALAPLNNTIVIITIHHINQTYMSFKVNVN